MFASLPPIRLTGGTILRDGALAQRSISIVDGRFASAPFEGVDLTGYYILPGIVDIHHSGLFRQIPDAPGDRNRRLILCDREAARHGVTTRFLSLPWTWEHPAFSPESAVAFAERWHALQIEFRTDLRLQICCETVMVEQENLLVDLIRKKLVSQILFTDHATIADDLRNEGQIAFAQWAWQRGMAADAFEQALDAVLCHRKAVPRHLCRLAERFDDAAVPYGSLGDVLAETREHYSMIGARICVMPGTVKAASAARAVGDPVVAAAGDVLFSGRSGLAPRVAELIRARLCEALVSDSMSVSPVMAVFRLVEQGVLPLERAWRLISERPADIMRLPDRGTIAPGKRADLTIVNMATKEVEATIANGRITYLAGEAAERFAGSGTALSLAAE